MKKIILDTCEDYLRKTNLSELSICMLLRISHFTLPYLTIYIFLFGSHLAFVLMAIISIVIMILFYYFDGCIYSMLEYRFAKDDWTAMDPVLENMKIEVNNDNRKKYTIYTFYMNTLLVAILYFIRFSGRWKSPRTVICPWK